VKAFISSTLSDINRQTPEGLREILNKMKYFKELVMLLLALGLGLSIIQSCDRPDLIEPEDNQEQTDNKEDGGSTEDNDGDKNDGKEDGTGNENGETPSEGEGEGETEKVKSMTITLEKVTATKAYFKASTKKTAPDIEIGIYYSQYAGDHIYDCERVWDYDLENGECELVIKDLDANTTYYYRPYLFMNGTRELGDELSFTTADYSITVDVRVDGNDVIFSGYADIDEGGILYSTDPQLSVSNYIGKLNSINGEYSYTLTNLDESTTYYYCTYYFTSDGCVYGDIRSFTTGKNVYHHENKDLSLSSAVDLSSSGTANCYIVSKPGLYKIKAVKGNDESQAITDASTSAILWETFGTDIKPDKLDLIKEFCYKDGYIVFRTADTYKEGNAVMAVRNAYGRILWSWHIWLTDQPQEHIYKNNAGTMMDRNLGATSATPGDVGALGLLYQWGRKDPFLGSSSISDGVEASSTIFWPDYVISDPTIGTISYAIAHPTTYIGSNNYHDDWLYRHDGNLWRSEKTIYDPCPVGWRVPDGGEDGVWAKALGPSSYFEDSSLFDGVNKGINFSGKFGSASVIWYPASGRHNTYGEGLGGVGDHGWYSSCFSHGSDDMTPLSFENNGYVSPSGSSFKANGYPVRCQKE